MFHNNTYLNWYSINHRNLTLSLFIEDVDGNGNGDWIDELAKLCYYTADFEDIDEVINNESFSLICCAAEEVDDLHQNEHDRSSELTCQRIFDGSGLHDNADEAAVVQHQSTEGNGFDFLIDLPEVALQELFDYYCSNGDSYSTSTTSTTTSSIATEREEAMTEYAGFSFWFGVLKKFLFCQFGRVF